MRCSARTSSARWRKARRSASRTTKPSGCRKSARAAPSRCVSDEVNEAGQDATAAEALSVRRFGAESDFEVLRRFARAAPAHLPRRPGYRRMRARRGDYFDTRRTLREAVRNDGDVMTLRRLKRRPRQRRILLLIDVSGSMKERTETHLRIAHALAHAVERIEVFTFGTRLTRVTRAMRLKHRDRRWPRPRPSSATGTAARASATPCGASSPCRASPATRAAPSCSSSPTGWSAATRPRCARP